jgi:hypothetical protein
MELPTRGDLQRLGCGGERMCVSTDAVESTACLRLAAASPAALRALSPLGHQCGDRRLGFSSAVLLPGLAWPGTQVGLLVGVVHCPAELGDVRRFRNSTTVVRHTGLDVTVHTSDTHRAAGHLSRQGPQLLRWALYESAKSAARSSAPDHDYYQASRDRRTAGLATISVARKLARRCYHTLHDLGQEALAPAA